MNRDLHRRLARIERNHDPDQVRHDVSSVPLADENGNPLPFVQPDRPLTEAEWLAESRREIDLGGRGKH